jgi:predicted cupin superfamily sugar epimerase
MMTSRGAEYWIRKLNLAPHPEGGYYRETYRAAESVPAAGLPRRYGGRRAMATAILFLLKAGQVSRLHRLKSDEVWHFYDGGPLTLHVIGPKGRYAAVRLGRHGQRGERLQATVTAGNWFGATVAPGGNCSLVGCTVAPGFDFADFELADRKRLVRRYPQHRRLIRRLTPEPV